MSYDLYIVPQVGGIDVLDGTPLLDIKPYVKQFDCREEARNGWVEARNPQRKQADQYTPGKLGKRSTTHD